VSPCRGCAEECGIGAVAAAAAAALALALCDQTELGVLDDGVGDGRDALHVLGAEGWGRRRLLEGTGASRRADEV